MICHRFTTALIGGRAVEVPGVQPYTAAQLAAMTLPCVGSRCALWLPRAADAEQGRCADNPSGPYFAAPDGSTR
jgi:hypothetical protein